MSSPPEYSGHDDESGLPVGDQWIGGEFLGAGGDGIVHVWFKVDETNTIIDRMVIKDMWSKQSTAEPKAYQGIYDELVRKGLDFGVDPSRPGKARVEERFFKEAYIQGLLTDEPGSTSANTVPLRGFKKGTKSDLATGTHWRTYMDWMHASDLANFVSKHRLPGDNCSVQKPIPEAFIWWTLSCLAEALVEIDRRTKVRPNARTERDEATVLIDMKLANVLLDSTRGSRYPVYPKPLIADFGSAHITYRDDPQNVRKELKIFDTQGYHPPESADYEESEGPDECLNSWTNVWQTGRIIESMMRLDNCVKINDWDEDDEEDRESEIMANEPFFDRFQDFKYSKELREIVWRCQRWDPDQRPTPAQIVEYINQHASNHNDDMDIWGTEDWIAEQEQELADLSKEEREEHDARAQERADRPELKFLRYYPDKDLRERYIALDMDIPEGCELAYQGKRDTGGAIGDVVSEDDGDDEMGEEEDEGEDDDDDIPDAYDEDDDDYDN
ncbi:hypothetical protein D6D01_03053 [Aureobasidium pullulans]|uniref:Protein kinase domain-containing protein n=1 Tax=Aureobasidium pullulans TaxID=5580 RepID=A0A4S9LPG4_AURPU|nr:hypothetical protein D6D01_03053 [Aureobasidium pullulans]